MKKIPAFLQFKKRQLASKTYALITTSVRSSSKRFRGSYFIESPSVVPTTKPGHIGKFVLKNLTRFV
jgi:hypothetical protein